MWRRKISEATKNAQPGRTEKGAIMRTELDKIKQANREGIRFGAQEMRDRIVAELEFNAAPAAIIRMVERVEVTDGLRVMT
jgi:hypothetical protein